MPDEAFNERKTISEPGSYEIRLYDPNEHLIAGQAFKII